MQRQNPTWLQEHPEHLGHGPCAENLSYTFLILIEDDKDVMACVLATIYLDGGENLAEYILSQLEGG